MVGEVENPQIAVRPNAEAILNAWPRWATAPSAADLAERVSCLSAAPELEDRAAFAATRKKLRSNATWQGHLAGEIDDGTHGCEGHLRLPW